MRKLVASALVALLVAAPGAAFAASATPAPAATSAAAEMSASGIVKAFSPTTHSLTLADGKVYQLPGTFKDPGIKVGSKVTVHWKQNGTMMDASSVSLG
ncbi:MAG: DUF1344 domain-containing protein [Alphaproteobacteria bacterium]|nr:DUF1344 domain-containing protein [Alphaproteobacteria bacterium]